MWTYKTFIVFPNPISTIMNVSTYFILAAVLGSAMVSSCPPSDEIPDKVQVCLASMMKFIEAEESQRQSACPSMKEGIKCLEDLIDSCKDNEALQRQYNSLKTRIAESEKMFEGFCNPNSGCGAESRMRECAKLAGTEDSEKQPDCSVVKKGLDCVDEAAEACKDDEIFQNMYKVAKESYDQAKEEFKRRCSSAVAASSSCVLILSAYLLSRWF